MDMDINLKLTADQVSDIVRRDLIVSYECAILTNEAEDAKYIKALRRVIQAYSTPKEWNDFKWTYRIGEYKNGGVNRHVEE